MSQSSLVLASTAAMAAKPLLTRPLAILLTLSGLVITFGIGFLVLVFAGAAAGSKLTSVVWPTAVIVFAAQAISALALLSSKRHVASVAVALGPLLVGLVAVELVFKVLPSLLKLFY
jgi:hypothetical protein